MADPVLLLTAASLGLPLKMSTLGVAASWLQTQAAVQLGSSPNNVDWPSAENAVASAAAAWIAANPGAAKSYAVQRDMMGRTITLALYPEA